MKLQTARMILKQAVALAMALAALNLSSLHAADIVGKVTLKGTPPPEKPLPISKSDPTCGKVARPDASTRFYVVGKDGALADVVVYISKGLPPGKTYPVPDTPVVIDQKGCEFVPYIAAAMAKQKVHIKNSDPFLHNVNHAPTPDVQKRPQNVAQLANGPIIERAFEKTDELLVRFKCDVHPWMFAYVAIFDHPFFAVTGEDGTFKISNVPPGSYTVEVYHRKAGKLAKEVTVTDQNQTVNFELTAK
jgi:uncharacterized protein (DUF2141 family)